MLHVTTINLTRDLASAKPDLGRSDLGQVDPAELLGMLETFRLIDPVENHDANPSVIITTDTSHFIVRTVRGNLQLFDPSLPETVELDPVDLVERLTETPFRETMPRTDPPRSTRLILNPLIVALGLGASGYFVHRALRAEPIEPAPAVALVADEQQITALRNASADEYRTGGQPGDRLLRLSVEGEVEFYQQTPQGLRSDGVDRFSPARDGRQLRFVTNRCGVIEVVNIDTLIYYGDTYHRTR